MRGGIWLFVIVAILVVTVVLHVRRGRLRRSRRVPLGITATVAPTGSARAAAEVLAALDSRPAGVPLDDRAPEDGIRQLFGLRPASLLVPFDDPGGGGLRGVAVARGALQVTNRHLRFRADDAEDFVWPVGDVRELVSFRRGSSSAPKVCRSCGELARDQNGSRSSRSSWSGPPPSRATTPSTPSGRA